MENRFEHVEQLFDYGSAIRKVIYTTNSVESIHSSFRKFTKKGAFANEKALFKILFLRFKELERKWNGGRISNWAIVRNRLLVHDGIEQRFQKYS